ncbi:hypothetical protein [Pseudomonas segetis]|uniref:Uncharacterized protein n=1 Tax=Pseudomonas segetis TaxID=298908 RepID=A0A239C9Y8_9PSED|nr:hypothetical protein [Pseudomonas segetis]SNS16488.1 hypothetical protein SAMN05216255_1568 [Pseudomonas segetis]
MTTEIAPDFTARNTWGNRGAQAERAKVERFLKDPFQSSREAGRAERIRKGKAIRESMRLVRHAEAEFDGTPWQRGCIRLLDQLLSVREAPNIELLFARNDIAVGMVEGSTAFGAITLMQCHLLRDLRDNAYRRRLAELSAR